MFSLTSFIRIRFFFFVSCSSLQKLKDQHERAVLRGLAFYLVFEVPTIKNKS